MTAENSNSNSNREGLCLELSNKPSQENIVEDFMLNDNRYFVLELDMQETKMYENVTGLFHFGRPQNDAVDVDKFYSLS